MGRAGRSISAWLQPRNRRYFPPLLFSPPVACSSLIPLAYPSGTASDSSVRWPATEAGSQHGGGGGGGGRPGVRLWCRASGLARCGGGGWPSGPEQGGLTCVRLWEAELPAGGRLRNRHGDGAAPVVRAAVWGEPGCSHRYS